MSIELYNSDEDFRKTVETRKLSCPHNCKDKCIENVIPDGGCSIAEIKTAEALAPFFAKLMGYNVSSSGEIITCTNCYEADTVILVGDFELNGHVFKNIERTICPKCENVTFTHEQSLKLDKARIGNNDTKTKN